MRRAAALRLPCERDAERGELQRRRRVDDGKRRYEARELSLGERRRQRLPRIAHVRLQRREAAVKVGGGGECDDAEAAAPLVAQRQPCVELPLRRPCELRKLLGGEDGDGVDVAEVRRVHLLEEIDEQMEALRAHPPPRRRLRLNRLLLVQQQPAELLAWQGTRRRPLETRRRAVALLAAIAVAALRHARHLAAQLIFKRQLLLKQHRHLIHKV